MSQPARARRRLPVLVATLAVITALVVPLGTVIAKNPDKGRPPKLTRFVEPRLVARVDFSERTSAGTLRQPSYKGTRDDVAPEDVRFG